MMNRRYLIFVSCAALLACAGCSRSDGELGTVAVDGRVTYRGTPLTIGEVRYVPLDAQTGRVARGAIDAHGRFTLTTLKQGDGALPGDYRIVVVVPQGKQIALAQQPTDYQLATAAVPPASPIPTRYFDPETSGLHDTVNDEYSGFKQIDLVD
jgi:hypothetical protein